MGRLELWVRSEWRLGWRALCGLALLIAIGGGVTLAAVAGARRADSAFDRFLGETFGSLAVSVTGTQSDITDFDNTWDLAPELAQIAGVHGVTPTSWMAVAFDVDGTSGEFFAVATGPGSGAHPPPGAHFVQGRAADSADEVTLNEAAMLAVGKKVGDNILLRSYATDQAAEFIDGANDPDRGPRVAARIVGVYRSAEDVSDNSEPAILLSSEFHATYADRIAHCDCALWIGANTSDLDRIAGELTARFGDKPLVVERVRDQLLPRVERTVGLEVGALQVAAVVAAVATGLVVTQSLSRHATGRKDTAALIALGATRPQIIRAWILVMSPAAVMGSLGAAAVAILWSPVFPRGLARRAEVDSGVHADAIVLVVGVLALIVAVVLATTLAARRATRSLSAHDTTRSDPVWLTRRLTPSASLGASFALNPSRTRNRSVAMSAIASLALAIGAWIAVGLIEHSIADVLVTPSAFAADWDMQLAVQPEDPDELIAMVMSDASVEAFAVQYVADGNQWELSGDSGSDLVGPVAFDSLIGSMGPIIEQGRLPLTSDEVTLGPATATAVGARVGDEVAIESGVTGVHTFRVSGIGRLTDGDDTDTAFVPTSDGLRRLDGNDDLSANGGFVRLVAPTVDSVERMEALGFRPTVPPSRVASLDQIGSVPRMLATALVALGLGGTIHSLLVAGSRRRSEIAVAKALGFTRRQAASAIRWQGVVSCAIAVLVGVPAGLLFGRVVWKQVATGVGAVDLVSIPWKVMLVTALTALAAVVVVASLVGHRVARVSTATALRSE